MANINLHNVSAEEEALQLAKTDLIAGVRWYDLPTRTIDIMKIEILDSNSRYNLIPKLADPHRLLKSDTDDSSTGDLT